MAKDKQKENTTKTEPKESLQAVVEVVNRLNEYRVYNLADGTGLHMTPKSKATITTAQLSDELRKAERHGYVVLRIKQGG